MKLIIVESPTKARELSHFLGREYKVVASMGHVRDLPVHAMGVQPPDFFPEYEPTERGKGVLAGIRKLLPQAETVYLASDPDREGESISWHLAEALRIPKGKTKRITYTEVTEAAVRRALGQPRAIDMDLVAAQEARRVADRIIGYGVSPALCQAGNAKLSAGRVQTPALRLVVEREEAIRNHTAVNHFGAAIAVDPGFTAEWNTAPYLHGAEYILDRELAGLAAGVSRVKIKSVRTQQRSTLASPPFTTSTFQQACSSQLGIAPELAMRIAQSLFETGKITYMRTDSVNLADEAIADIRAYAQDKGLPLPARPNVFRNRSRNAQEAHEAIRPVEMREEGRSLNGDARRVYELIHRRTLLCQLAPLEENVTTAVLEGENGDKTFEYKATGYEQLSPGFTVLLEREEKPSLPTLAEGEVREVTEGEVLEKKTQAPGRFTEASLLAELERRGIGRPSTWAAILSTLYFRKYIATKGKFVVPTALGSAVSHALEQTKFADYAYTANLEETLDKIAEGHADYQECVASVYAEAQRDARSIKPFQAPIEASSQKPTGARKKSTRGNPATAGAGTRRKKTAGTKTKAPVKRGTRK